MKTELSTIRHSASHILAQAVQSLYPDVKLGIGPAIEDGFYYDFDMPTALNDQDLARIEKRMRKIIEEKQPFQYETKKRAETEALLQNLNQTYKLEIVNDLNLEEYSFYQNGPFIDLCRGPHLETTRDVPAFKLLRVSGAYWKGSEKNKMLQRIYGTAFHSQEELDDYVMRLEEAKKRDHRLLGKQLDLFSLSEEIGGGLVLWHPKGATIRHLIESTWRETHIKAGYDLIYTPHVGKGQLWETSGHLQNYKENMYSPIDVDGLDYFIKPMNCPFHILIYKTKQRSYRQLPQRYAELGTVYRYERSGVLHGLFRVRGFTQDDAHLICSKEQVHAEIESVLKFCFETLNRFGFTQFKTFISTKPAEKAVGDDTSWVLAQDALEQAVKKMNIPYEFDHGGGAFYGPKIDIKIEDAIGREWQCSTIQFDFNLPERFDMSYINAAGQKERPIMIHRALLGSIERFFGILIEHYAGKFPLWLAPVQVKIVTIHESGIAYATEIESALKAHKLRIETDYSDDKIGQKIRNGIQEKIPYLIILGKSEIETKTISVRALDTGETQTFSVTEWIKGIEENTSPI